MLITATTTTLSQIFSPPFRAVLWKALGLTVALFIGLWFALEALVSVFLLPVLPPWPWLTTAFAFLLGGGIVIGGGFVLAPVSAVFAGIFLDDVAEAVERKHYPSDPVGNPLSVLRSTLLSARFLALVVGANLLALALVLFVGLGVVVFFLVNGYLLGREYFQFAALRHGSEERADALRQQHSGLIFLGGLIIAAVLAVPFVNLIAPLFAAGLMVHLHKQLARESY